MVSTTTVTADGDEKDEKSLFGRSRHRTAGDVTKLDRRQTGD